MHTFHTHTHTHRPSHRLTPTLAFTCDSEVKECVGVRQCDGRSVCVKAAGKMSVTRRAVLMLLPSTSPTVVGLRRGVAM